MKIKFTKPFFIENECVTGEWKVGLFVKTTTMKDTILICKNTTADFQITFGSEYLRQWLKEGIVSIID